MGDRPPCPTARQSMAALPFYRELFIGIFIGMSERVVVYLVDLFNGLLHIHHRGFDVLGSMLCFQSSSF
jgi:hypothetical protein